MIYLQLALIPLALIALLLPSRGRAYRGGRHNLRSY